MSLYSSRKPGAPSDYFGHLYKTELDRQRMAPSPGEKLPEVLAEDGLLVVETSSRQEPELPLAKRTSRRYGSARLTLFEPPT